MLLPENKAYDFIAAYTNLLHYAGATHGLVPEEQSMEEFTKGGTALLVECRELLIEDPGLLDEFAADGAAEHPDFFFPILRAVGRMRPFRRGSFEIHRSTPSASMWMPKCSTTSRALLNRWG